ncbi:MAG: hypothetical protein AAF630_00500 [Cyanobacteria bacterium P01_C01_bin.38]
MSKKKPRKTQIPRSKTNQIQRTILPPLQGVSFSFKYFQPLHEEFNISQQDGKYLNALLLRLKDLCSLSSFDLKANRSSSLRCHPIDWKDTSQDSFGIIGEEQIVDQAYQFSLSANQYGRVHGFFIQEVFYIVWLDPNHKLYPGRK